jgi:hypothetical protein
MLDNCDAAAETAVGLRQFQADIPASKDDQMIWQPCEIEPQRPRRTLPTQTSPGAHAVLVNPQVVPDRFLISTGRMDLVRS